MRHLYRWEKVFPKLQAADLMVQKILFGRKIFLHLSQRAMVAVAAA